LSLSLAYFPCNFDVKYHFSRSTCSLSAQNSCQENTSAIVEGLNWSRYRDSIKVRLLLPRYEIEMLWKWLHRNPFVVLLKNQIKEVAIYSKGHHSLALQASLFAFYVVLQRVFHVSATVVGALELCWFCAEKSVSWLT
jgi:hypothetical protein